MSVTATFVITIKARDKSIIKTILDRDEAVGTLYIAGTHFPDTFIQSLIQINELEEVDDDSYAISNHLSASTSSST